jgi:hypothetical protein
MERIDKKDNEDDEKIFICVKVKINITIKKEKIVDYWFE